MHVSLGTVFTDRMKMLGHNKASGGFWGSLMCLKGWESCRRVLINLQ